VVEPAKNCSYFYPMTLRDITPTPRHVEGSFWLWNPWSQSRVRTSSAVVGHIFFEISRKCLSLSGIMKSRHSRRMLPIKRSQKPFARGLRNGVFGLLQPSIPGSNPMPGINTIPIVDHELTRGFTLGSPLETVARCTRQSHELSG